MVVLSARIEDPSIQKSLQRKLRRQKRIWRIVWLVLLVLIVAAGVYAYLRFAAYGRAKAATLVEEGKVAEQQFELTHAVELYEQALALKSVAKSAAAEAALRAGLIFENKGDHGGAQSYLKTAEQLDSHSAAISAALGRSYLSSRLLDQAEEAFTRALKTDPKQSDALYGQARVAFAKQDAERGDQLLDATLDIDKTHAGARLTRAIRSIHEEPVKSAKTFDELLGAKDRGIVETARVLETVAEQLGGDLESPAYELTLVGAALNERNEFDLALLELTDATSQDKEYRDAWVNRAVSEVRLKSFDDARVSLENATELDPSFGFTRYVEGLLAEATGDLDGAREGYEQALKQRYVEPQVYSALAGILDQSGDREQAIKLLRGALRNDVESEQIYDTLFWFLLDTEEFDEALQVAEDFRDFNDRSTTAEGMVALANFKLGKDEPARKTAESLLARDPLSAIGNLVLGLLDEDFDLLRKARDLDFGGRIANEADKALQSGI